MIKIRNAFTMLELIFVIVVMGILGTYGVELLARAYQNFIFSKVNSDLQARSGASVEFITKRLEHRIKQSTRFLNTSAGTANFLSSGVTDPNADILEWIATDDDSFRGINGPLWSGVIDLNSSTATALISPGSDFSSVNTYISNLTTNLPNGASSLNDAALYFIDSTLTANPWGYNGQITTQSETLHPIQSTATNNILAPNSVDNFSGKEVSEYYKLTWTANAIQLDYNAATHKGMLYFYHNYQPWRGETYLNGTKVLLAEDISAFRFRAVGSLIKIQVCAKSDLIEDEEYGLCKEKTVF